MNKLNNNNPKQYLKFIIYNQINNVEIYNLNIMYQCKKIIICNSTILDIFVIFFLKKKKNYIYFLISHY